jgi:hypothetical protein
LPASVHALTHRRGPLAVAVVLAIMAMSVTLPHAGAQTAATAAVEPATPDLIASAVDRGEITEAQGALFLSYAFTAPDQVPEAYRSSTPWSGTLPLLELKRTLKRLGAVPAAAEARSVLRASSFDCSNFHANKPNTKSTAHFYLQYTNSALQGLTVNQYGAALETTWSTEIGGFGWARPPKDPVSNPPGGRYPVRIESLGSGLYGFVTGTHYAAHKNNPATPWNDRDAVASCMVLNQNFGPFPGTPTDAMRATVAHEFNHSLQFGYGALGGFGSVDSVFVEGGATWMEDEVFDTSNDNYNYLWPSFTTPMGKYAKSPYPYWIVFRAMTEPFGTGNANGGEQIFQTFWEQISKGDSTNLQAMNKGFQAKGSSLAEAYHDASIALRFLRNCSSTAEPYCLEEGPAYAATFAGPNEDLFNLGASDSATGRQIANDFALNWVGLPTVSGLDLAVTHQSGKGILEVSIACRTGNAVTVTSLGRATPAHEVASVTGYDGSGCDEVSAVISNVKMTSASPSSVTKTSYDIETS